MTALTGVLAPVVTPFGTDGELDLDAFRRNVRMHIGTGVSGIVVAGSTGEAALLDEAERGAMIEAARELVTGHRVLLAGTGAESTRTCLRLTRAAAERGADAALVVAPHYFTASMTAEALFGHYRRVADGSPIPVVLYNIPKYMHFQLAPTLVSELAMHQNVIGIKDSSGDRELLAVYLNNQNERFAVLTGSGALFQTALQHGAKGAILAVSLFAPALAMEVWGMMQSGDIAAAERAQALLSPLSNRIVGDLGVAGVKAAMDLVGLAGGDPRSPLLPLTPRSRKSIRQLFADAGIGGAAQAGVAH
ncbi:MAG: dihydrodipicolinate synthetase [Gemmatimonadetes bacterium]|nr:dihydrodipicolinate synthetase [Gemmatimonadota bacterium]